jgi:hypothetical protein
VLHQGCNSTCCPGSLEKVAAVLSESPDAHEQIAGAYLPGIVPNIMDLYIDRPSKDLVLGPLN